MGVSEKLIWTETMVTASALADYSAKQYYGAKMNDDREIILPTADADIPVGLVLNKPSNSENAQLLVVGRAPGVVGEAIDAGEKVRIGSDGKVMLWETTDTTCHCIGQCVEGATADGELGVFNFSFPSAIDTA